MKKLLSLVLVIALIVLMLPTAMLAGDGSSGPESDLAPFDFENLLAKRSPTASTAAIKLPSA